MRPVLLELDGFASFRTATAINFDDADYFVLVGATGSGKSTVIDAITFALYASVARWDKENVVSPALAPTAARGTVKFVFDAKGSRYIVIRDVRRNASTNQVTIKTSRIERLLDPTALGAPDDDTEPLGEGKAVKAVVEALLGLDFNQFTKCVALPQGDVAEFLHASAAERQKILTKLLGIEVYTKIQQAANSLAAEQNTRADTLEGSIAESDAAAPNRLHAAQEQVANLEAFKARVETQVQALAHTADELAAADGEQQRLEAAHTALSAVRIPDNMAEIDERRASAAAGLAEARTQQEAAEAREEAARLALEAAPSRAALERVASLHQQHLEAQQGIGGLEQAQADAEQDVEQTLTAQKAASTAVAGATGAATETATEAQQALAAATAAQEQLNVLAAVVAPVELQELDTRRAALVNEENAAQLELDAAISALSAAQLAQAGTHDPVALERARAALEELLGGIVELASAREQAARAEEAAATDAEQLAAVEAAVATAEEVLEHARAADSALVLRGHLSVGDACPVCEQTVATLPAQGTVQDLAACAAAVDEAKAAERTARTRAQSSHSAATVTAQAVTNGIGRVTDDRSAAASALQLLDTSWELPAAGTFEASDLAALEGRVRELQTVLREAIGEADTVRDACRTAEVRRTVAEDAVRGLQGRALALQESVSSARGALRQHCDELLPLGRPTVDTDDPVAGWQTLVTWAGEQLEQRTPALTALTAAADQARERADAAAGRLEELKEAEGEATGRHQRAIAAEAAARAQLEGARAQLTRLAQALAREDSAEAVTQALEALSVVEDEARSATADRVAKRTAADQAQAAVTALEGEIRAARTTWAASRDQLLQFGTAPAEQETLAQSWDALVAWAQQEALAVSGTLGEHTARIEQVRATYDRDQDQLRAECSALGIVGPDTPVTAWVVAEVAGAQARAAATVNAIEEEQRRNAELQRQADEARERAQVASTLGNLLRADNLPRWLASNALDVLVAAASETLRDLSGGQFELTSDDGGFQVIDRHDTDAVRGVKTLSGGETFQAALALALALSSQLGTLTASAAAQLEAIFIDEGFGTLDEATLDVVASTLEELAASGGRMVGVITHVPALADRVPVRFKVRRDADGSHVEREHR